MCAVSDTSGELLFVSSSLLSVILLEVSMWLTPPRLLQDVAAALLVLDVTSATSLSPVFIIIINYHYNATPLVRRTTTCMFSLYAIVGHTARVIWSIGLRQLERTVDVLRTPVGLVQCWFEFARRCHSLFVHLYIFVIL